MLPFTPRGRAQPASLCPVMGFDLQIGDGHFHELRHTPCQIFILAVVQIDLPDGFRVIHLIIDDIAVRRQALDNRIAHKRSPHSVFRQMICSQKLVQFQ